jgi:glycine hydroxymethyltransferase
MPDYLFRGSLEKLDPDVYKLTQLEAERQYRKLILIASESTAPMAVREALSSAFQNIYAEGYPDEDTRVMDDEDILDYPARLGNYRRNSDPRYYKGVEYADTVEALARRRAAQTFAANGYSADQIFVNVQALIGRTCQQRGLSCADQPRRHRDGTQPAARRTSLSRLVGQPLGEILQGCALHN